MAIKMWFRMWPEAKNDRKLDALTDPEFRVWFKLLCAAAEDDERGSVDAGDSELLAIELGIEEALLTAAIARMARLGLTVMDGSRVVFPSFLKRQYEKPSDTAEAVRERKRKQREREAEERASVPDSDMSRPCHAHVTPMSRRGVTQTEQNRTEQNREEQTRAGAQTLPACLSDLQSGVSHGNESIGWHPTPAAAFWHAVESEQGHVVSARDRMTFASMLATCPEGCTGDAKCLPVLLKAASKSGGKPSALFARIIQEDR